MYRYYPSIYLSYVVRYRSKFQQTDFLLETRIMFRFSLALIVVLASLLLLPFHENVDLLHATRDPKTNTSRILLLTAHPDDECFFFSPTILALQKEALRPEIYSLCLSTGNSEGLRETRRMELGRSLDVMGIEPDKRWVVDHP